MSEMTLKDWTSAAAGLSFRNQIFIDGQFVPSASGKTFASINPATGAVLANVAEGDEEDIRRAVTSGRKAFESGAPAAGRSHPAKPDRTGAAGQHGYGQAGCRCSNR